MRRTAMWVLCVVVWLPAVAMAQEQRRLELLGQTPREQQRAAASQAFLQGWLRRAAGLYLHRLDALACRSLFSLGDEARFGAAIGSADATDHNLVFLEGAGAPSHLDSGPYVFPADTFRSYWPATADKTTFWHEVNHALLDTAGVGVVPAGHGAALDDAAEGRGLGSRFALTSDTHHVLVEGVGQRGSEAYELLLPFEDAVRRADRAEAAYVAEGRDVTEYGVQRQLWGEAHQRFSAFLLAVRRVAHLAPADLAAYRAATGVFFSSAEVVAEWYRKGGLQRDGVGLTPPAWVFYPDLLLMPVQVQVTDAAGADLEQPGAAAKAPFTVKDDVFRQVFVVRLRARGSAARRTGSAKADRLLGGPVGRGTVRLQLVEDDELAGLAVSSRRGEVPGLPGPGGASVRVFEVDLEVEGQPLTVTLTRRKLSALKKPTTLHVKVDYRDPAKDRRFDAASASVALTLSSGTRPAASESATTASPTPSPSPAVEPAPSTAPALGEKDRKLAGFSLRWGPLPAGWATWGGTTNRPTGVAYPARGEGPAREGAVLHWKKGVWGHDGSVIELFVTVREQPLATLDDYVRMVTDPDPHAFKFQHSETTLGGFRAYVSSSRLGTSRQQLHWFIGVAPERKLWVTLLTDTDVNQKGDEALKEQLVSEVRAIVATLAFIPDAAGPGLAVTRSADKPVPPALQDAPIPDDVLDPRPPPPPPQVVSRGRRATSATPGASPSPSVGLPPPPPRVGSTSTTTGAPRPVAATVGAPPPPRGASPPSAPLPIGQGGAGLPSPGPVPAPPSADSRLQGTVVVVPQGVDTIVRVTNTSRTTWHDCAFLLPQQLGFRQRSLDATGTREVLWKHFKPDPTAPVLSREVLVRCREGSLRSPAPL